VVCTEDRRGVYRDFIGRSEEKEPLEKPRRRLEDNTETNLKEAGWAMNWIAVAQSRAGVARL
jgi:hypothetical protein